MGSKFLRAIDLDEVSKLLPVHRHKDIRELEASSIPAPFLEEVMWQFDNLLAITMPEVLLDQSPEMAYPDGIDVAKSLAIRLDYFIIEIFEYLQIALTDARQH